MNKQNHPNVLLTGTLRKLLGRQRSFSEKHTQLQLAGPEGWLVRPQAAGADNRPRASSGAEAREEERSDPPASWSSPTPPPSRESSRLAPRRKPASYEASPTATPGALPGPRAVHHQAASLRSRLRRQSLISRNLERPHGPCTAFDCLRNKGTKDKSICPVSQPQKEAARPVCRSGAGPLFPAGSEAARGHGGGGVGGLLTFGSCCSISASCSSSFSMSACSCFLLSSFSSSACWAKSKEPQGHGSGKDSHQGVLKSLPGESRRARRQREREADRPTGTPIRDSDPGFPCRSLSRLLKIQHRDVPCPEILSRGPPAPTHTLLLSLHATDADGNYPSGSSAL